MDATKYRPKIFWGVAVWGDCIIISCLYCLIIQCTNYLYSIYLALDIISNLEMIAGIEGSVYMLCANTVPFHLRDSSICRCWFLRQVLELTPCGRGGTSPFDVLPSSVYNMTGGMKNAVTLLAHTCTFLSARLIWGCQVSKTVVSAASFEKY